MLLLNCSAKIKQWCYHQSYVSTTAFRVFLVYLLGLKTEKQTISDKSEKPISLSGYTSILSLEGLSKHQSGSRIFQWAQNKKKTLLAHQDFQKSIILEIPDSWKYFCLYSWKFWCFNFMLNTIKKSFLNFVKDFTWMNWA
jgi:hypothetical protein